VIEVPPGRVPDLAAAVRDAVGGRAIDTAKALGASEGLAIAAVPTTLSVVDEVVAAASGRPSSPTPRAARRAPTSSTRSCGRAVSGVATPVVLP